MQSLVKNAPTATYVSIAPLRGEGIPVRREREADEAFELDRSGNVAAWVKNDHLGFEITYSFRGIIRKFRPDYLIPLVNGKMLLLEMKGQDNQEQQSTRPAPKGSPHFATKSPHTDAQPSPPS